MVATLTILVMLGAAILLVIKGWRGRRVGTSPHCGRCGFDLSGVFPIIRACPECGSDLNERSTVRHGRLERRWKLLLSGATLLVLSLSMVVLAAQWTRSASYLAGQLSSTRLADLAIRHPKNPLEWAAFQELNARVQSGALTETEHEDVLDAVMDALESGDWWVGRRARFIVNSFIYPSGPSASGAEPIAAFLLERFRSTDDVWFMEWGGCLRRLHDAGVLADADWQECVAHSINLTPRICGGNALEPCEEFLVWASSDARWVPHNGTEQITFGLPPGTEVVSEIGRNWESGVWERSFRQQLPFMLLRAPRDPGEYAITVQCSASLRGSTPATSLVSLTESGTGAMSVRSGLASGSDEETFKRWLERHLVPGGLQSRGYSRGAGYHFEFLYLLVTDRSGFRAKGRFARVDEAGSIQWLSPIQIVETARVPPADANAGDCSEFGAIGFSVQWTEPNIDDGFPPGLALLFDEVSLPDGRTYAGPQPIMIELPTELLVFDREY